MEPKKNKSGKTLFNLLLLIGIPVLLFMGFSMMLTSNSAATKDKSVYSDYIQYFVDDKVEEFSLDLGTGKLKMTLREAYRSDTNKDGKVDEKDYVLTYTVPNVSHFVSVMDPLLAEVNQDDVADNDVKYDFKPISDMSWIATWLPIILLIVMMAVMFLSMRRSFGGESGPGKIMGFGKAKIKQASDDKRKTTFDDVAGADEEKEELREVVEFLKDPRRFTELGARVPKGVLLVGPPGTGKTLLARAVAGEAGVHFLSISGSDFVELYVGVGASRVRDLFDQAKKESPAIVFIDEIDAVGRQRGAGLGGGHDEREQTLNQLLVEMDGFSSNEGVIVLAATNRVDILDPALLRPGRFDRQVYVGHPDIKGREAVLRIHARNKPLAEDVSLAEVAKATVGFTGADLENLMNEAALLAARRKERFITNDDLHEAVLKVIAGPEKKSRVVTEHARKLTAYHEAGHAIVINELETADPVHQITIIPRGGAGGMTISLPQEDKSYQSKRELAEQVAVCLGGRVAEELMLGDISTGASNDLERATAIARAMVTKYGMSDKLGTVVFDNNSNEVFIGRSMAQARTYSEEVAGQIDAEIRAIIDGAYERCRVILSEKQDTLVKVAEYLLEHETMSAEEFQRVCNET